MPGKPGPKPKKPSLKIALKIASDKLSAFPSDPLPRSAPSATPVKDSPHEVSTPGFDVKKEGTPAAGGAGGLEVPQRKKPGPPKGTKRKIDALLPDGTPKPRGKPGPKKRKLDGDEGSRPWTTPAGPAAHKLGPKANQGAINAGLRALDRSGKPCRKWAKKTFRVKSFTGQVWDLPCWGAPRKAVVKPDGDSGESKDDMTRENSEMGNTPGMNGIANGMHASSDAGGSVIDATPKEGSAVPPASSPAPTGTPMDVGA